MATAAKTPPDGPGESFFSKLISNVKKLVGGSFESQIRVGRAALDMPAVPLAPMQKSVMACSTGPYGGLCQLQADLDAPTHESGASVAGVTHWQRPQPHADGDSITLYEHKTGSTQHHGDPIADVYAVVARPNSCIIAVADGVNWGIKPRLAARCAVHGAIDYLNSRLFDCPKMPGTTQDVFHNILRSFHSAQKMIIDHGGTTTTLCVAVVVELQHPKGHNKWGLCVVSVGDSLCYVWRKDVQQVYEITSAMHQGKERNPHDCGGCLGCDLGDRPDLSNLVCCFVPIADGDIVFVASDGVSDNLDPVLLKEAISDATPTPHSTPIVEAPPFPSSNGKISDKGGSPLPANSSLGPHLPTVSPEQRQELALLRVSTLLKEKHNSVGQELSATCVKEAIINYVIEATDEKRNYLEQCWMEQEKAELTVSQRRANDRKIGQTVKNLPGKLDHATIAAYQAGKLFAVTDEELVRRGHSPTHSYVMNTAMNRTSPTRHNRSFSSAGGSIFYFNPKQTRDQFVPSEPIPEVPLAAGAVSFPI